MNIYRWQEVIGLIVQNTMKFIWRDKYSIKSCVKYINNETVLIKLNISSLSHASQTENTKYNNNKRILHSLHMKMFK